jgi:hypothetical protein
MEGGGPACRERGRFPGSASKVRSSFRGPPEDARVGSGRPPGDRGVRSAGYRPAVESRSSSWFSCDAGSEPRGGRDP